MSVRWKIFFKMLLIAWRNHRAKVLAKKIKKWKDENRYSEQWKNDFVLKRSRQYAKLLKVKINVQGYDNLVHHNAILVPNHASFFDSAIVLIALAYPHKDKLKENLQPVFLAKKELKKNRFIGYMNVLSTFYIDRESPREAIKIMDQFIEFTKKKQKLAVIFPEGKRSNDGKIHTFKTGAFHLAKKFFLPIIPVTINNSIMIGNFKRRKTIVVNVIFEKPIKPLTFVSQNTTDLAQRIENIVRKNYIIPTKIPTNSKEKDIA